MDIYEIMHKINSNFQKKAWGCVFICFEKPKNMHPLALTPEKHHKFFFPEISSMKISFFKSRSHHVPVQNQQ